MPTFLSVVPTCLCQSSQSSLVPPAGGLSITKVVRLFRSEEHVLVVDGSLAPPVQGLQLVFRVPGVQERGEGVGVAEECPAAHRLAAPDVGGVRGGSQRAVWREGGAG